LAEQPTEKPEVSEPLPAVAAIQRFNEMRGRGLTNLTMTDCETGHDYDVGRYMSSHVPRPKGEKRPADVIGAPVMVAKIATGEIEDTTTEKNQHARSAAPIKASLQRPSWSLPQPARLRRQ